MTRFQIVMLVMVLIPIAAAMLIQVRDSIDETRRNNEQYERRGADSRKQKVD